MAQATGQRLFLCARAMSVECDPIGAMRARTVVFEVAALESVVHEIDILATLTSSFKIIGLDKMENDAIVSNIGHFDNEIRMAELQGFPCIKVQNSRRSWIAVPLRWSRNYYPCLCQPP